MTPPSRSTRLNQTTYDRRKTPAIPGPRLPRALSPSRAAGAAALAPLSVTAECWAAFVREVELVRHGGTLSGGALRQAVKVVVIDMRAADEPWEAVYGVLASVVLGTSGSVEYSANDTHASRAAALVAHMHSWADCVRLDELNAGDARREGER